MANRGVARLRWYGAAFLALAAGMLIGGQTVLKPRLEQHPAAFVFFWCGCFLCTGATLLIALLDLRAVRKRARREHNELAQKTLSEIIAREKSSRENRDEK